MRQANPMRGAVERAIEGAVMPYLPPSPHYLADDLARYYFAGLERRVA